MLTISINCTNAADAQRVIAAVLGTKDAPESDDGEAPKKRGRPTKEAAALRADEAPAKKPAPKKVAAEIEEDDEDEVEEDDEDEADEDDEDEAEEDETVDAAGLVTLKKALTNFSKAKGSKDAAVKILRKFAPSSEKVKAADLPKLLKALKV